MHSSNGLHAILFDLDGTLRHNQPTGFETFVGFARELGQTPSPEQLRLGERWTHYYWSGSPEMKSDMRALGDDTPEFWQQYAERQLRGLGISGDVPELAAQIMRLFAERYAWTHHVPDDALPTLDALRAAGYTLGLVSNRKDPLDEIALKLGLTDAFDFTLSAGQAESWKPAPGIFLQAAALAGCEPGAAMYVGDNFYADIQGAQGAGLRPVLIDPRGLFPEAECPVIRSIGELTAVLEGLGT